MKRYCCKECDTIFYTNPNVVVGALCLRNGSILMAKRNINPRKGLWTMAFVTNESKNKVGEIFYHLFVPTTPNPTSGVFIIVPKKDATDPEISVEAGLRTIVSGGIIDDNISIADKLSK